MQPWQERVVQERDELMQKIEKLAAFIDHSEIFPNLPKDEQRRLQNQHFVMVAYHDILDERIVNFNG